MVPIFSRGSMRVKPAEFDFWRAAQHRQMGPNHHGTRIDNLSPLTRSASDHFEENGVRTDRDREIVYPHVVHEADQYTVEQKNISS